jgi:hypothetical protein
VLVTAEREALAYAASEQELLLTMSHYLGVCVAVPLCSMLTAGLPCPAVPCYALPCPVLSCHRLPRMPPPCPACWRLPSCQAWRSYTARWTD